MSLEPKPRSMAAVTITVLRCIAALVKSGYMLEHPSISQYFREEVTICGVLTISRKDRVSASKLDVESSETIRQTSSGYAQEER